MLLSNIAFRLRNIVIVLYAFLLPLDVWCSIPAGPQKDIEIHVHNGAIVSGQNVILGDVATIYSRSIQDFEKLSTLVLSNFPDDKESLRIPASYIELRIREVISANRLIKIELPEFVDFKRASPSLSPEEAAGKIYALALEQKKIPDGVELVVEFSAFPQNISAEDYSIQSVGERQYWRGESTFKLVSKDNKVAWIKAHMRWMANAWVAKREIKFLQDLRVSDFEQKKIDITSAVELPLLAKDSEELAQKIMLARTKRSLRTSIYLTASMLDKKPDLAAGQNLKVIFVSESGLRVEADGSAINDALVGSMAKARLKKSKKIISGKLVNSNLIEVSL